MTYTVGGPHPLGYISFKDSDVYSSLNIQIESFNFPYNTTTIEEISNVMLGQTGPSYLDHLIKNLVSRHADELHRLWVDARSVRKD